MNLDDILTLLSRDPNAPLDIAEIALYIAKDEYPVLDIEAHISEINAMAHEARTFISGDLESQVHGLCRYLFHEMGFRGNATDYYDPQNSYVNTVLERRTGIPITLSVVAMAVGNRAGMDVVGVGLPGHFIAKAVADGHEVLFDPFHGGRELNHRDCANLVTQVTGMSFEVSDEHLKAIPLAALVQRMFNNLKAIYLGKEDFPRGIRVIERLLQLDPENPLQRRDLGASLLRNDQPGKAINHLEAYLSAFPSANDQAAVEKLILQARRQIAQWN